MTHHALRVVLIPIVALLGLDMATLIGGAVVVEQMFGLPGITQVTVQSLVDLDLPVVVGVVLTTSFLVVFFNLVVDVAYALVDPRLRRG
jgi:peptide/nickel transport system permease protein